MNTLGRLEKLLLKGHITEEQYTKKKTAFVDVILELYIRDLISKEEMYARLND